MPKTKKDNRAAFLDKTTPEIPAETMPVENPMTGESTPVVETPSQGAGSDIVTQVTDAVNKFTSDVDSGTDPATALSDLIDALSALINAKEGEPGEMPTLPGDQAPLEAPMNM